MTEERDFFVLCTCFCGGCFLASVLLDEGTTRSCGGHLLLSVMLLLLFCVTGWVLLRGERRVMVMDLILFVCGGCGYAAASLGGGGEIGDFAVREKVGVFLGSLPFEDKECNAFLTAILTGDRRLLSAETKAAFRDSGASHILALSGMHLGIIYSLMAGLLKIIGNSPIAKAIRTSIIIILSGVYTLATGACESLVRAFLFILIKEGCRLTGRKPKGMRVLCCALIIQLTITPLAIDSVGFKLSYLAMCGICILLPKFEELYPKTKFPDPMRKLWSLASMSISCQVFTAPAVWYYFGTFPQYFLITNLIAMPLTSLIMSLGLLGCLLFYLGVCPSFLLSFIENCIQAMIFCLRTISEL
jgi:competence protein ComEC